MIDQQCLLWIQDGKFAPHDLWVCHPWADGSLSPSESKNFTISFFTDPGLLIIALIITFNHCCCFTLFSPKPSALYFSFFPLPLLQL